MALLKHRSFQVVLIVALLLSMAATWRLFLRLAQADSVHWYDSLEEASPLARQSNRPMLLDFWATWCAACQGMEKDVFTNPVFSHAAKGFVAARVDYDKESELARAYKVTALPTLVFTDSFGGELFQQQGFLDANMLARTMHSLSPHIAEFNRLDQILAHDRNNFDALKTMGEQLRSAGLFLASNEYYGKALATQEATFGAQEQEAILTEMGANSLDASDGQHAAETFEKCLKDFPGSKQSAGWTLDLSRAYTLADKKDKARKLLEAFLREHPGSAESQQAKTLLASL